MADKSKVLLSGVIVLLIGALLTPILTLIGLDPALGSWAADGTLTLSELLQFLGMGLAAYGGVIARSQIIRGAIPGGSKRAKEF